MQLASSPPMIPLHMLRRFIYVLIDVQFKYESKIYIYARARVCMRVYVYVYIAKLYSLAWGE